MSITGFETKQYPWLQTIVEDSKSENKIYQLEKDMFFSQKKSFHCPASILLNHGTRGSGKSNILIKAALGQIGMGFGSDYKAVIFRREYKELEELKDESFKIIKEIYGDGPEYNISGGTWTFPSGEQLKFRYGQTKKDYYKFHGHQYSFIGIDEISNYPDMVFYELIKNCLRSANPRIRRRMFLACNPYGPNHNKLKTLFIDRAKPFEIFDVDGVSHCHIGSTYKENPTIMSQPDYIQMLTSNTDENLVKAWAEGDWNITSGGIIDDVFKKELHLLEEIDPEYIQEYGEYKVGFDMGSESPYAAVFIFQANRDLMFEDKYIKKDDYIIFDEVYGCKPNDMKKGINHTVPEIQDRIVDKMKRYGRPASCIADSQIFAEMGIESIASRMSKINFKPCIKSKTSRVQGLNLLRELLSNAKPDANGMTERQALYITNNCKYWLATVCSLGRCEKNPEDADTKGIDHLYDATRYALYSKSFKTGAFPLK